MGITAVLTALIPHVSELKYFLSMFFINGCFWGSMEAGANMMLLHLWGKEVSPFMQGWTFFFGVGSLLSPVVAQPFLLESKLSDGLIEENNILVGTSDNSTQEVFLPNAQDLLLVYPYSIVALILTINSAWMLLIFLFWRNTEEHPSRKEDKSTTHLDKTTDIIKDKTIDSNFINEKSLPDLCVTTASLQQSSQETNKEFKRSRLIAVILTMMWSHIYYGLVLTMGSFLVAFAVESNLRLTKSVGTQLTSIFWGICTFFRLAAIFYIEYIGNELNIWLCLTTVVIGNIFLIPFGNSHETCLWIGVAVIGLGTSSMWSCMFSYIEDYSYFQNSLFSICICSHRRVYLSAHHFIFHLFRPNDLHVGYSSLFFLSCRFLCDVGLCHAMQSHQTRFSMFQTIISKTFVINTSDNNIDFTAMCDF